MIYDFIPVSCRQLSGRMSFEVKSPKQQVEEAKKESFVKEDDGKATFREMPLMYAGRLQLVTLTLDQLNELRCHAHF